MTHTVVTIGYIGIKRCYLDVDVEEAKRRYAGAESIEVSDIGDELVRTFEIGEDGEFSAYDAWSK